MSSQPSHQSHPSHSLDSLPNQFFHFQSPKFDKFSSQLRRSIQINSSSSQIIGPEKVSSKSPANRKTCPRIKPSSILRRILNTSETQEKTTAKKVTKISKERKQKKMVFSLPSEREIHKKQFYHLGQLLLFQPNAKNSKSLLFISSRRTTVSVPICEICGKIFINFKAFGGHLRICQKKKMNQI